MTNRDGRRALTDSVRCRNVGKMTIGIMVFALMIGALTMPYDPAALAQTLPTPSRSTSIAMTTDDRWVVVANRETNSVSVIQVRDSNGADTSAKLAEIPVGQEPRYVALSPDNKTAYVSNTADGTVSVISLDTYSIITTIQVGAEPRGLATTPNGTFLYVANHTEGTVSVINTRTYEVVDTRKPGGNPTAIAITNDGDDEDTDEHVFVTQFYAELIKGAREGFDDGKQGIVNVFAVGNTSPSYGDMRITLSPIANVGFTADRTAFCPQSNENLHDPIFCPDVDADPASDTITADPQGAFPNQLQAALIRSNLLYLPNIGAGPEPPVRFNVNVQALVHVADAAGFAERTDLHVNLNQQVARETQPDNPTASLDRLFGNDLVAIDATQDASVFLIVSRGGNFVFRASPGANGLGLGAPVVRYQTGNIPNGVVISRNGDRAYTNNEVDVSVTAINLETDSVIGDIPSGKPPEPGTPEHAALVGKLAFHTALGTPDNGIFDLPVRDIVPLADRGKASDNAWSSCASCHPDGLSDGVTWFFPTGPRQTVPLDAFFSKEVPEVPEGLRVSNDQRISNWNAVRGSITDFNNNSRNIQGGEGFAGDPPDDRIFNHGITQGASDALDAQTLWVQVVRAPILPVPDDSAALDAGRATFDNWCARCHGGVKWTKSEIFHQDNPAFDANPLGDPPGMPIDPGVENAGPQIVSYAVEDNSIRFLEDVGTFNDQDPVEIRGAGGAIGRIALGGLCFNVPSLLGTGYHAPYLHNGAAQTLEAVFPLHALGDGTIESTLSKGDRENLIVFLKAIDGRTEPLRSEGDDFRDALSP